MRDETLVGHRQVTGLLVPGLLLLVLALLVALAWSIGSGLGLAASVHWLALLGLLVGTRRSLSLRLRHGASEQPPRSWSLAILRLLASLLVLGAIVALWRWAPTEAGGSRGSYLALGSGFALLSFGAVVLARYYQATPAVELPDGAGLAAAFRVGAWLALATAGSTLLRALGQPLWESELALALQVVPLLAALELLMSGIAGLLRRPRAGGAFGADLLVTRLLGSSFNLLQSVFTAVELTFGVDVRSSWALSYLRRASPPVLAGMVLLAWLLSAVVVVDSSQRAVRERFGHVDRERILEPGLHLGLPWPLDLVKRVEVTRVRELPLGYVEAKAGADALWTKYHAAEEYNLLLGDGRDLVTINADLHYRIGDIHAWLYGTQNPELALETVSYRVLMDMTANQTLDQVLSVEIGAFASQVEERIQLEIDDHQLGVEVVAFNLRGLHPPVAVANDYQAVVAAQIDRTTYTMEAQAYRYGAIPKAEANAVRTTRKVQADQAGRLSRARGEAIAFETLEAQYNVNPELYRFRRRLETLESSLQGSPHYVIDARIEREGGALWILE